MSRRPNQGSRGSRERPRIPGPALARFAHFAAPVAGAEAA